MHRLLCLPLCLALACPASAQKKTGKPGKLGSRASRLSVYRDASARGIELMAETIDASKRPRVVDAAMTLLAISGDGSTAERGPHKKRVQSLLALLQKRQWADGRFYDAAEKGPCVPGYDQALATWGLLECAARSRDADLRSRAAKAGGVVLSRVRKNGSASPGYDAAGPADFATTAWSAIVMGTMRRARIGAADHAQLEAVCAWLREQAPAAESLDEPLERVVSRKLALPLSNRAKAGLVLFVHLLAGLDPRQDETLAPLAAALLPRAPAPELSKDPSALAFVSLAGFQIGGPRWRKFTPVLERETKALRDSETPGAGRSKTVRLAMRTLAAQTYWRYGPLVRRKRGK